MEKNRHEGVLTLDRTYQVELAGKTYQVNLTNEIICRQRQSVKKEKQEILDKKAEAGNPEYRYEVVTSPNIKPLGEGGFGSVKKVDYSLQIINEDGVKKARATKNNKPRVFKMMLRTTNEEKSENQKMRFTREEQMMIEAKHMHAKLYVITDTAAYFVMRHLPGDDLKSIYAQMNDNKLHFTKAQRYELSRKLFLALDEFHQRKILHLDIKPENIKVELKVDDEGKVKDIGEVNIFDFNLSLWLSKKKDAYCETGRGSLTYRSPESFEIETNPMISSNADTYSMTLTVAQLWNAKEPRVFTCKDREDCYEESKNQSFLQLCENVPDLSSYEVNEIKQIMHSVFGQRQQKDLRSERLSNN